MLDWKSAFVFMTQSPNWRRQIFWGGLLLLIFPPLGWPLALGYRKEVAFRLIQGTEPVLPDLWLNLRACFRGGFAATGVLLLYYLPFVILFWILALDSMGDFFAHIFEIAIFFILIPFLVPLFLPLLPPYYWYFFPWVNHSSVEIIVLCVVFLGTTFVMPSAFLQTSLEGSFTGAFRLQKAIRFICANPLPYLEAWVISVLATGLAFLILPLFFWLVFWSYLVIIYAFNEVLAIWDTPEVTRRFCRSRLFFNRHSSN